MKYYCSEEKQGGGEQTTSFEVLFCSSAKPDCVDEYREVAIGVNELSVFESERVDGHET